jgi:uncharacterized protein DUF6892
MAGSEGKRERQVKRRLASLRSGHHLSSTILVKALALALRVWWTFWRALAVGGGRWVADISDSEVVVAILAHARRPGVDAILGRMLCSASVAPMLLTHILRQTWLEPDEIPRAIEALVRAATIPDEHPALVRTWIHLAPLLPIQPVLFGAFAAAPPSVLRAVGAELAGADHPGVLQCYAAAIELGNGPALLHVKSALDRLRWVTFSTYEAERDKLRGLASDGLLVRCASRALRRLRPRLDRPALDNDVGGAFQLFALVVVAGDDGAGEALGQALHGLHGDLIAAHLRPRLALAAGEPHVVEALSWLERAESPSPLPFRSAPLSSDELCALERPAYVPAQRDERLQLALVAAAIEAGCVELPAIEPFDPYEEDDEILEANRARVRATLLAVPIPHDFLRELRVLQWDGSGAVARLVDPDGGGESDRLDVRHLFHLSDLEALEELSLELPTDEPAADLSPLRVLRRLARFTWWARVASLAPLLDLPALESVTIRHDATAENEAVVRQLAERGVTLTSR